MYFEHARHAKVSAQQQQASLSSTCCSRGFQTPISSKLSRLQLGQGLVKLALAASIEKKGLSHHLRGRRQSHRLVPDSTVSLDSADSAEKFGAGKAPVPRHLNQ
jgi:hypothetical protein